MRTRQTILLLALLLASARAAPEPAIEVLHAESYGDILDVLIRLRLPPQQAQSLRAENFAVFIAPADLPSAKATSPDHRVRRVFLKRLGESFFLDLRQLPPGTTAQTCQLILQVRRGNTRVFSARLPGLLKPAAKQLDVALLIDESLSMRRTDPEELRLAAAKTFVDLARTSTRIGNVAIVAFNNRARTLLPPTPRAHTSALYQAIERIRPGGQTDMDAALDQALTLLEHSPAPAKAALLLTDGKDEPGRYRDAHQAFARRRWPVYTVGLSQRADAETLERIARQTGGEFHLAPTNAQLQEIFSRICLTLLKKVPIRRHQLALRPDAPAQAPFLADETITSLTISAASPLPNLDFALLTPDGKRLTPQTTLPGVAFDRKAGYQHFDLWTPGPGRWSARLSSPKAGEAAATASAATPLLLRAFPLKKTYYRGEPIEIAASLACGDSILPIAAVAVEIASPEGTTAIKLFDDGRHQDTAAADGVFAGIFPGAESPGPCSIRLLATGRSPGGHPFERELLLKTAISPEGYSRLWCSARELDLGILYTGEKTRRAFDLKLTTAVPSKTPETIRVSVQPPRAGDGQLPRQALTLAPTPLRLAPGKLLPVAANLAIPPDQPPGRYETTIRLTSNYDEIEIPLRLEVRRPSLIASSRQLELPAIESGGEAQAALEVRAAPRGTLPLSASTSDKRLDVNPATLILGAPAQKLTLQFSAPDHNPTEHPRLKLTLKSPAGELQVPVVANVIRPVMAVEPRQLDFGSVKPGQRVERTVKIRLEGLTARPVEVAAQALARGAGAPALPLEAPAKAVAHPAKALAIQVALRALAIQPPGTYRGILTVRSPLGEHQLKCTAAVPAVATFTTATSLDFGRVAIGSTVRKALQLASTADAPQSLRLVLPEPTAGCTLTADPPSLDLPPRGKATVAIRLTASPGARPGPRMAPLAVEGPSLGAKVDLRADLFRPPHQSIALEPPEADLGRLGPETPVKLTVRVRSLVDEAQRVAIERIDAPEGLVAIEPGRWEWNLGPRASLPLELAVTPLASEGKRPFEALVVARGRSLPAKLRIRGTLVSPPGTTLRLGQQLLDFGTVERSGRATLPLTLESLHGADQQVELTRPPASAGLSLAADRPVITLAPGAVESVQLELVVADDAPLGPHHLLWPIAGAGQPQSLEVAVEVVPKPTPAAAGRRPTGIGWQEGLIIFLLLAVLLAALIAAYLLARWLIRTQRLPRMTKYFALSALLHAVVLFTALDLFVAHKTRKKELGELFRVGLKAMAPSGFTSQRRSLADDLRARRERERRLQAERRKRQAAQLARKLLEQAKLASAKPATARLERPEEEQKPRLVAYKPKTEKLTIEELARILEEVRETQKVTQETKKQPQESKPIEPDRLERLRKLSRQQLQAVIHQALQPKKAAQRKPRTESREAPSLVSPSLASREQFRPEELVPALQGLKAAARAQAAAKTTGTAVGPREVGAARAARAPSTARLAQGAAALPGPSAPAPAREAARPAGRPAAGQALTASLEPAPTTTRRAAVEPQTPGELAPAVEPVGAAVSVQARPGAGVSARSVALGRAEAPAPTQRAEAAGQPLAPSRARQGPLARNVAPGATAAPALEVALAPASALPQSPPFATAVPEELPPTDAAVRLPTGAERPTEHVEAAAVAIAPGHGPGKPSAEHAPARASRPTAPGPRAAATSPAARREPAEAVAPPVGPTSLAEAIRKASPPLEPVVLVEGPLAVAHYEEPGRRTEVGAATVVARWELRLRGGARATQPTTAPVTGPEPRRGELARPTAPRGAADLEVPPVERAAAPKARDLEIHLAEAVREEAPRPAEAAPRAEEPAGVAAEWTAAGAPTQRTQAGAAAPVAPQSRTAERLEAPRERVVAETLAPAARNALPRAPGPSPEVQLRERVQAAQAVVAAKRAETPEAQPTTEEPRRGELPRPQRLEPRPVSPTMAARALPLERRPTRPASRLLLPSLARGVSEAGTIVGEKPTGTTRFVLTTIRYGSGEVDWDTHKTMMSFLAWQLRERVGFNVESEIRVVPLESPEIMRLPWLFMSGHKAFRFTDAQVANLRRYLVAGGTLWADDSTHEGDHTWDNAFRREIARVLPPEDGYRLRKITKADNHPLFRSCFDLSQGYKGYFPPPGDKYRENYIQGVEIGGRLAVIYTRNDYGDGLEIQPDTFPLKVSLSGLSPAEMQESAFLMASNIVVYILGRGHGHDPALVRRAAQSLRHHFETQKAKPDPYANAPATVFDDFSKENWLVEDNWDGAGPATLRYLRKPDPQATGRRMAASLNLDQGDVKTVLVREIPEELDLTGQERCYVELESKLDTGARLALAVITLPDWKYFESRPAFIKPGEQTVHFDLHQPTWKTGEPVPEGQNEYCRRPANLNAVRRFVLLIYPLKRRGAVVFDRIEFRAKP